jgi:hypothetical protein
MVSRRGWELGRAGITNLVLVVEGPRGARPASRCVLRAELAAGGRVGGRDLGEQVQALIR